MAGTGSLIVGIATRGLCRDDAAAAPLSDVPFITSGRGGGKGQRPARKLSPLIISRSFRFGDTSEKGTRFYGVLCGTRWPEIIEKICDRFSEMLSFGFFGDGNINANINATNFTHQP